MHRIHMLLAAAVMIFSASSARAQGGEYQCPAGATKIGRVCLSADQQTATCLYPDKPGGTPKQGTTQDANPATCPRHPPKS